MRKLELEIQQLEKDASRTAIIKTMTHDLLALFFTLFNCMLCPPTGSFNLK